MYVFDLLTHAAPSPSPNHKRCINRALDDRNEQKGKGGESPHDDDDDGQGARMGEHKGKESSQLKTHRRTAKGMTACLRFH